MSNKNKLAVLDLETDPFEHGKMVQPFLAGFYDGKRVVTYWGPDSVLRLVTFLQNEATNFTIYAHNGGRFDFFYFLPYLSSAMRIVNGRLIQGTLAHHEIRDSYAIMPFPLADYDKDSIDYEKMRADVREKHRYEIERYLRKDLTALYDLVVAFHQEFGDKLTIGSTAMKELRNRHKFSTGNEVYDAKFRSRFYFGGRNQVFKSGITKGRINVYDVNSMYPFVMQGFLHPIGTAHTVSNRIEKDTCFIEVEGKNYGAFPTREKDGSLNFTRESGVFYPTIHEWEAAIDTGCFKPRRIIKTYGWRERGTFADFVTHFYDSRRAAKRSGDKIRTIFYKYVLNSAYGKFAQNPDNYFDWYITEHGQFPPEYHECVAGCAEDCHQKWSPTFMQERYIIWQRPLQTKSLSWYNIAIGASITGAARAVLLRGIAGTSQVLYCDTDSIICCGSSRVEIDPTALGKWDLEATGSMAAIGGKKLYAIFKPETSLTVEEREKLFPKDKTPEQVRKLRRTYIAGSLACIKKAHKGARLTASEILAIVNGDEIESANPVPNFKWDGSYTWTKRRIKMTA